MKKIKWILIISLLIAGIYMVSRIPVKGKITVGTVEKKEKVAELLEYDGKYLKFSYPSKYQITERVDSVQLLGASGTPVTVVIAIKTGATILDDISGVAMRRIKSTEYFEEKFKDGLLFVKSNPYELAAFFIRDGKSVIVALVANSNDERTYRSEFEKLVESIEVKTD